MLTRRAAMKVLGASGLMAWLPGDLVGTMERMACAVGTITDSEAHCTSKAFPLNMWGVGGNFAVGMTTANRLLAFQRVKAMGCAWVKDSISWVQSADPVKLAQHQESRSQCDSLGLRYFVVFVLDAPVTEPGGGGGAYPTAAAAFATYAADCATALSAFCSAVMPYAVAVGAEHVGPQWWLPDGVALDKYSGVGFLVAPAVVTAYIALLNAAKAVAPADVLVGLSSGDGDHGYVRGWLTEIVSQGGTADFAAPYDYRNYGGHPFPYWWEGPEAPGFPTSKSGVFGRVDQNIQHYRAVTGLPVLIPETGYNIGGSYNSQNISQDQHASLISRTAILAAAANPLACCFIGIQDEGDTTSGLLNADFSPRPTYTALASLLPILPAITQVSQHGDRYEAKGFGFRARWWTDSDRLEFSGQGGNFLLEAA